MLTSYPGRLLTWNCAFEPTVLVHDGASSVALWLETRYDEASTNCRHFSAQYIARYLLFLLSSLPTTPLSPAPKLLWWITMPPKKKLKTAPSNVVPLPKGRHSSAGAASGTLKTGTRGHYLRGKLGALRDMLNMPLDVLIQVRCSCSIHRPGEGESLQCFTQIFDFLHPRHLLNLARTSKDFRALLMDRKSAPWWRAARSQIEGLPPCPKTLSEPAYANLLFFNHCHVCSPDIPPCLLPQQAQV